MEGLSIRNGSCFLAHLVPLVITGIDTMFSLLGSWVERNSKPPNSIK